MEDRSTIRDDALRTLTFAAEELADEHNISPAREGQIERAVEEARDAMSGGGDP